VDRPAGGSIQNESYRSSESLRNSPLSVPTEDTFAGLDSSLGHDRQRHDKKIGLCEPPHNRAAGGYANAITTYTPQRVAPCARSSFWLQ